MPQNCLLLHGVVKAPWCVLQKEDVSMQLRPQGTDGPMRRRGIAPLSTFCLDLRKDPVEGCCKVSLQQMLRADRRLDSHHRIRHRHQENRCRCTDTGTSPITILRAKEKAKAIRVGHKCCPKRFVVVIAPVLTHTTNVCVLDVI